MNRRTFLLTPLVPLGVTAASMKPWDGSDPFSNPEANEIIYRTRKAVAELQAEGVQPIGDSYKMYVVLGRGRKWPFPVKDCVVAGCEVKRVRSNPKWRSKPNWAGIRLAIWGVMPGTDITKIAPPPCTAGLPVGARGTWVDF